MQTQIKQSHSSWRTDDSPLVLGEIFTETTSIAIWNREANSVISDYFSRIFDSLGMGINGVFEINSLKQELTKSLPEQEGIGEAVDDIYLLSDMLTCLFDCQSVGLRLVPLTSAMCPSFHVDNIPVRLVNTYLGAGTQWLALESLHDTLPTEHSERYKCTKFGKHYLPNHVQQMQSFDVGLLKGKAWQNHEHLAAVHRSCPLKATDKRVLLTLDPM